ncbi:MAG TPA: hypothetical protein VG899_15550 [Mycobacteriales bacterium]|nr:hypothetical protein [Mycobacteriales bacterium]
MSFVFTVEQLHQGVAEFLAVGYGGAEHDAGVPVVLAAMNLPQPDRADGIRGSDAGKDGQAGGDSGHRGVDVVENELCDLHARAGVFETLAGLCSSR